MRDEYIATFLRWARWQRFEPGETLERLFEDEERVIAALRTEIANAETRIAIGRFADGEPWEDIQEAIATGRRYEPPRWL